jgi:adenosylcobinamide-GDP ribazoletransferase
MSYGTRGEPTYEKADYRLLHGLGHVLRHTLPCKKWDGGLRPLMIALLPLIGLILGALWLAAALLLRLAGPAGLFGAAVMTLLPWALSGFMHLDGYMDCCDAILSRRDLPERQRILKDPHAGTFAVVCLTALALLEFSLFASFDLYRPLPCCLCPQPRAPAPP